MRAEERGWDGVFLWDHILWRPHVRAVAGAWVALSAIAARTNHIRLGPLVTPLSRRRVHKVARETATLDLLSHGRLILGVGLGSSNNNELEQFGEVVDPANAPADSTRGLAGSRNSGWRVRTATPTAPRIPIWVAAHWPHRRPLQRAARWDGVFPIALPGPEALADIATEIAQQRNQGQGSFDLVVDLEPGFDPTPLEQAAPPGSSPTSVRNPSSTRP